MNPPNNLPIQLSSFIGRELEITEVKRLLKNVRLVTLTGAGGCGKTRLATEVATDLVDSFPQGVWWIELAALNDSALVPQAVIKTLGLSEQPSRTPTDSLVDYFQSKHALLGMDNCEHLIDGCAQLATRLLQTCPHLTILATSREAMNTDGEFAWIVPSLQIPIPNTEIPISKLQQYDAIRLFVERASAVIPDFELTKENAISVAQICRRLDGIPLAIELAAARVKVLSVEQIAERLDDALRLLTEGKRNAPQRHQTLRATMDWSYDLLSEPEQTLFRRLSVFAGGFTLEAEEAVCTDDDLSREQVLSMQTHLVEKSLVIKQEQYGQSRYRMLETIRDYAREKLSKSEEVEHLRQQHCDFFIQFVEQAETKLKGTEQMEWLDRLETEHDNLRASLACALQQDTAESVLRLGGALWRFWRMRSYWREGTEWLEKALAKTSEQSVMRANALHGLSVLVLYQGDLISARSLIEECLALRQAIDDERGIAESLALLGVVARNEGDYLTAHSLTEQSLTLRRSLGDTWGIAESLRDLANVVRNQGDYIVARSLDEESLALWRKLNDKWGIAFSLYGQGLTAAYQGDYQHATTFLKESLVVAEELKDKNDIAFALYRLGEVSQCQDDYEQAELFYEKSLSLFRDLGDKRSQNGLNCKLGYIALRHGNYERARMLFRKSLSYFQERDQKQGIALSLAGLAEVAVAQGQSFLAGRLFRVTEALVEAIKASMNPVERIFYDRSSATVRAQFDQATFVEALAEGRAITLEEAFAEAEQIMISPHAPVLSPLITAPHDSHALTPREVEVLRLLAEGLSDAQIAEKLVISRRTVNTHLTSIYNKLDVNSRSAATRYALDHKLT